MLPFEKRLPSTRAKHFPVTLDALKKASSWIDWLTQSPDAPEITLAFEKIRNEEKQTVIRYIATNQKHLSQKFGRRKT